MVPISRGKQLAGIVGALAIGYALPWLVMPGPGTGPVESFRPNFHGSTPPVIVAPAVPSHDERSVDASQPLNSAPAPLQSQRYEPI